MTLWRVDFKVKSDAVLEKDRHELVFKAPDGSHEIHLLTKRGPGAHQSDELYISAHVIVDGPDRRETANVAEGHLRRFLDLLSIVTSAYYRIDDRILVADWTPGLTKREFLYFKTYPDPNVPTYILNQGLVDSVQALAGNEIPPAVRLAIRWWARGVGTAGSTEQFQYFWYSLEILAEHTKPSVKIASKCPYCQGELFCQACNLVPVHRPFPKQAIKLLIEKHVTGDREALYRLIDRARNRLLHGDDPRDIERGLGIKWDKLTDLLGTATWAALLSALINLDASSIAQRRELALIRTNTFSHVKLTVVSDIAMGAKHADPAHPQIEEFWPTFKLDLNVKDRDEVEKERLTGE